MSVAIQIILFLISHRDEFKQIVLALEQLAGDLPGSEKSQAVKGYIAAALNLADQIEKAWPLVAPIFNAAVAAIKKPAS